MQTVCGPADQSNENTWRADISADRRHVNVLLDLSEEETKKDLQPHEYHCSPGWDEAVCGWRRVAPYAGLFLAEDTGPRPKHKDIEHDASTSGESYPKLTFLCLGLNMHCTEKVLKVKVYGVVLLLNRAETSPTSF
uniref:Uncharacterized protein n=1 Tax=Knipowitschia caucasica TaxID=637954 RepID=A0AAV2LNS8_KNICA